MVENAQAARRRLARPQWASPTHPVYTRELKRWQRARRWRLFRVGCAPLALLLFAGIGCILSLLIVGSGTLTPQERLLSWLGVMLWSLFVGQAFVSLTIGLVATAMASTVISSEIESETYSLLRVTDVPPNEIALAKYAATLSQLRLPVLIVVATRLLLIIAAIPAIDLAIRTSGASGGLAQVIREIPLEFVGPVSLGIIILVGLVWLAYFTLQPVLAIAMHTSVGLFASSIARTRTNAIITAAGMRVVIIIVRQIATSTAAGGLNIFFNAVAVPLPLQMLSVARPAFLLSLGGLAALVPVLWNIGWRGFFTYIMLSRASRRAARLPFE